MIFNEQFSAKIVRNRNSMGSWTLRQTRRANMYILVGVIDAKTAFDEEFPGPVFHAQRLRFLIWPMDGVPLKTVSSKHDGWNRPDPPTTKLRLLIQFNLSGVWKHFWFCLSNEIFYEILQKIRKKEKKLVALSGALPLYLFILSVVFFIAAWKRNVILVLVINYALGQPKPITTTTTIRPPAMCASRLLYIFRFAHELCVWGRRGDRCLSEFIFHFAVIWNFRSGCGSAS